MRSSESNKLVTVVGLVMNSDGFSTVNWATVAALDSVSIGMHFPGVLGAFGPVAKVIL